MHVIDIAGLRKTSDEVEVKGIERTWEAIRLADLVIFLAAPNAEKESEDLKGLPSRCTILDMINKADLLSSLAGNNPNTLLSQPKPDRA